jgi:hypothetical protein
MAISVPALPLDCDFRREVVLLCFLLPVSSIVDDGGCFLIPVCYYLLGGFLAILSHWGATHLMSVRRNGGR